MVDVRCPAPESQEERPDVPVVSPGSRIRFTGVLPNAMLRWRRPVWWQEIAIIAVGYWLYGLVRNGVPEQVSIAMRHGRSVQHVTEWLHLDFERALNNFVARNEWLAQGMDYYYATLHFVVTIGVMIWLYVRRPQLYRGARTALIAASLIGLAGFYLYPLAPPRLLPQYGYVDTIVTFHTWGSWADPNIAQHSNQFAAMPSLHTAWALWCGLVLLNCARPVWLKVAGLLYPLATIIVIAGTANHFLLDAVGGAVVLAGGFAVQRLFSSHGAFTPPADFAVR